MPRRLPKINCIWLPLEGLIPCLEKLHAAQKTSSSAEDTTFGKLLQWLLT